MVIGAPAQQAIALRGICKSYGKLRANDDVDLSVDFGEIHALVGENGAGKSTLMGILFGLVQPDAGSIVVDGEERVLRSTRAAIDAGLGMVHQSFKLFPSLTVAENVVFAAEPTGVLQLDRRGAVQAVQELSERFGLGLSASAQVGSLPVGLRQRVEILKALYRRAKILILDEPTAVLTPQERDGLFEMLRALKDDGRAVVLVTHKLNEVMSISDRLTVLRGGRSIVSRRTCDTNPAELARDMTGRDVDLDRRFASGARGDVVLTVENLSVVDGGMTAVKGVSLEVRSGEIVAIAGVAGNGQSELLRALTGLSHVSAGRVQLGDTDITHADVDRRRRSGLAYVPEDRHETGTAPEASISDNLVMGRHRLRDLVTRWRTHRTVRMETLASSLAEEFAIKTASVRLPAQTLSGGNLQKVVLAREISATSRALIVEQPTRGVDIGAIEYIHQLLDKRRQAGLAILLVSSELSEIFALADRILVMFEGAIIGELARDQADEQSVGLLMAGVA